MCKGLKHTIFLGNLFGELAAVIWRIWPELVRPGEIWAELVRPGEIWAELVRTGKIWLLWMTPLRLCRSDERASRNMSIETALCEGMGEIWSEVVRTGEIWCKVARTGEIWPEVVRAGDLARTIQRIGCFLF
jgi:hypothetical protein